ncbi:MAG TPA: hypothetical protein VHZ03_30175 [Trebonia sp.]|jgi:hypothetical protein|nr:hypothetical protein [Trebonia sp.]
MPDADDIALALLTTMGDAELIAHVAELRGLLRTTPRTSRRNERLVIAFGAACRELSIRGLPYDAPDEAADGHEDGDRD